MKIISLMRHVQFTEQEDMIMVTDVLILHSASNAILENPALSQIGTILIQLMNLEVVLEKKQ